MDEDEFYSILEKMVGDLRDRFLTLYHTAGVTGRMYTLHWKKACEKAPVADCTPRDIRHKSVTDMKKTGFNDAQVGHVVAHSDPKTTKRYTHFSLEQTRTPLQALAGKTFLRQVDEK
jgi:integrase